MKAALRVVACTIVLAFATGFLWQDRFQREARLQDLAYARERYVLATHAFSPAARKQALAVIHELEGHAATLSNMEFLVAMSRLTALAHNAHDHVSLGEGAWQPQGRLPLRIIWFPDAMVIARAGPPVVDLAGARITAVEGVAQDLLFKRLEEVCGGNENYCRWTTTWAIEYEGALQALGIAKSADKILFSLLLPDGRRVKREVEMVPFSEVPDMRPTRLWSSELTEEEARRGWRAAIDSNTEPFYLRDADEPFRFTSIPSTDAAYLQFRINRDLGSHMIKRFAQDTSGELRAHHGRDLVLDLRFDVGGDITQTRELLRELPNDVTGRIYLLAGRYTFSAGIVAAAIVKYYGRDRVTIVGEGVADRLHWWSEGKDACLPNSHLCLRVSDGLWDLIKGCAAESDCYGDRFVPPVGSLDPQLKAPLTAAAWLSGRDPGMEAIMTKITKSRKER
jgi:hypothetical protein